MSLFPNGRYRIFNARFTNQASDLLDGGSTSSVAGHSDYPNSVNNVVRLCAVVLLSQRSLNGWTTFIVELK